ncbi:MAG TPA: hypothetical protein VFE37_03980 [Chloroflexota bacterium]|nr:hypothetical protein [Chloroflexota bacterium]
MTVDPIGLLVLAGIAAGALLLQWRRWGRSARYWRTWGKDPSPNDPYSDYRDPPGTYPP